MTASLKAKIADVFDEPGCDKNQAKDEKARKKGCTKQLTPGAAEVNHALNVVHPALMQQAVASRHTGPVAHAHAG